MRKRGSDVRKRGSNIRRGGRGGGRCIPLRIKCDLAWEFKVE